MRILNVLSVFDVLGVYSFTISQFIPAKKMQVDYFSSAFALFPGNQAALKRIGHRLDAAVNIQFVQNILDMIAHCGGTDR